MSSTKEGKEFVVFKSVDEFREYAEKELPANITQYINSACGEKFTLENNCDAFKR